MSIRIGKDPRLQHLVRRMTNSRNNIRRRERCLLDFGKVVFRVPIQLLEKLATFNRERIPERIVHAKGSAAHGTLTITNDITKYSKAAVFSQVGKQVLGFLRFSTVAGERGAADAERDVRGFALKFYTEEGNWDLVGNNTPVFFVRDPLKFPDFIHTQKRDPKTNMRNNAAAWDFWSLSPESLHQVTILMSDRGLPRNYRQMNGYGSHTYSFINAKGERFWVKFHFKTMQGHAFYGDAEAANLVGDDRESAQRDLFENIERGNYPRWRFCIQVMSEADADTYPLNPFDLTKVWPHSDYPLIEVGILEGVPREILKAIHELSRKQSGSKIAHWCISIGSSYLNDS